MSRRPDHPLRALTDLERQALRYQKDWDEKHSDVVTVGSTRCPCHIDREYGGMAAPAASQFQRLYSGEVLSPLALPFGLVFSPAIRESEVSCYLCSDYSFTCTAMFYVAQVEGWYVVQAPAAGAAKKER